MLLRGKALDEGLDWRARRNRDLNTNELDFIGVSNTAHEQSGRRRLWLRATAAVVASLALIGLVLWQKVR